jgi:hypothetical protein
LYVNMLPDPTDSGITKKMDVGDASSLWHLYKH